MSANNNTRHVECSDLHSPELTKSENIRLAALRLCLKKKAQKHSRMSVQEYLDSVFCQKPA